MRAAARPPAVVVIAGSPALAATACGTTEERPDEPRDPATLKADARSGRYAVHVGDHGIEAAALRVARPRPSARNDLLQS